MKLTMLIQGQERRNEGLFQSGRNRKRAICGVRGACVLVLLLLMVAIASPAQTFTTLANFNGTDGSRPGGPPVQGFDGDLYGTTQYGGTNSEGTTFKVTLKGSLTSLYSFCAQANCADGGNPIDGLVQGRDGNLYGTTASGGSGAGFGGTAFRMTPQGSLTTLYSFCSQTNCADGRGPNGLIQAASGAFYGTTGPNASEDGGTVFKLTATGSLTTLYRFAAGDGAIGLIQGTDGNFYGTTLNGGAYNGGTVYKITPAGVHTILYSFCAQSRCYDGSAPGETMVQAADGNFYGVTWGGGHTLSSTAGGTVFKITPQGELTTLYSFCASSQSCPDGSLPASALIQATDGNFYGTTDTGGGDYRGTVFRITPDGVETVLHSFSSSGHAGGLFQATDGNLYGTKSSGAPGSIFKLNMRLKPFVETLPTSGKAGLKVIILGTNLTGASSVSFNGTAATFKVVSASEITTNVPAGATSGTVEVTTPSGTLQSNVTFRVP